jgi:hypothetical protein
MSGRSVGFEFDQDPQPERFVFHYTSLYGVMAILASDEFQFSAFKNTNDPRENKTWNFGIQQLRGDPAAPPSDEINRIVAEMGSILRESVQLACFTQDEEGVPADAQFLRGYSRARNWSQYADRHRGACLAFDRDRFEEVTRSTIASLDGAAVVHCGPVRYADMQSTMFPDGQMLSINTGQMRDLGLRGIASNWIRDHWNYLYFRKNMDWASEREYRVLTPNCSAPVRVPLRPSLLAVVLGADFPVSSELAIARLIKASGPPDIQVARMGWVNGAPGAYTHWA